MPVSQDAADIETDIVETPRQVQLDSLRRLAESGRVSATRTDTGDYQIDPAELYRVFLAGTNPLFASDDVRCRAEIVGERHGRTLSRHCGDRLERPGSDGNSSRLSVLRRPYGMTSSLITRAAICVGSWMPIFAILIIFFAIISVRGSSRCITQSVRSACS